MKKLHRDLILATRPWSFTMSVISVFAGSFWAIGQGFSLGLCLAALMAMICIHGASNLMNDYFDVKNRVDVPNAPTTQYRPHPLAFDDINLGHVLAAAALLYALGIGIGIWLTVTRGLAVLAFGLAGVFLGLIYTAPPISLKYHTLGEPLVFLIWGPLAMQGAYFVQMQHLSWSLALVSIPLGLLVSLVLLANNLRDTEYDRQQNISTISVRMGYDKGKKLFLGLVAGSFFAIVAMSVLGPLSPWSLLVMLSLPLAWPVFRMFSGTAPSDADARTAKFDTAFGGLLLISILLDKVFLL